LDDLNKKLTMSKNKISETDQKYQDIMKKNSELQSIVT